MGKHVKSFENKGENKMNNAVKLFENPEFGKVRVVLRDGEPWFEASDVAKALGFRNVPRAIRKFCGKDNVVLCIGAEKLVFVSEERVNALAERMNNVRSEKILDWLDFVMKKMYNGDTYYDIGYVYVIYDKSRKYCKIGKSKNPLTRVKSVCSASGVKDVSTYISRKTRNASRLERNVHSYFDPDRVHGEWFRCDLKEVCNYVDKNTEEVTKKYEDMMLLKAHLHELKCTEQLKHLFVKENVTRTQYEQHVYHPACAKVMKLPCITTGEINAILAREGFVCRSGKKWKPTTVGFKEGATSFNMWVDGDYVTGWAWPPSFLSRVHAYLSGKSDFI